MMRFLQLPKEQWEPFFDHLAIGSDARRRASIEVSGESIGDQVIAERLPLNGFTYDRKADAFYVFSNGDGESLDHTISSPLEIWVELVGSELSRIVVREADGQQQFISIDEPIALPAPLVDDLRARADQEATVAT